MSRKTPEVGIHPHALKTARSPQGIRTAFRIRNLYTFSGRPSAGLHPFFPFLTVLPPSHPPFAGGGLYK